MSVAVMTWVFKSAATKNAAEQAVLLAIADSCDDEGTNAYPSVPTIAKKARLTQRSVFKVIDRLSDRGVVSISRRASRRGTNVYTVLMVASPAISATSTPELRSPLNHVQGGEPRSGEPCPTFRGTPVPRSPDPSSTSNTSSTPRTSKSPKAPALAAEPLQELWNEVTTPPIPRCLTWTPKRRRQGEACLRERGLDGMRLVFQRINAAPFCRGEGVRGWLANIDWALNPESIVKVLEGLYDTPNGQTRFTHDAAASGSAALAMAEAETRRRSVQ